MSHLKAFSGGFEAATLRLGAVHGRFVATLCVILICGCLACAGALEMRFDRSRALAAAAQAGRARAGQVADILAQRLDSYVEIAQAFSAATTNAETSSALSKVGGAALRDVVVLAGNGQIRSEMTGAGADLLPLDSSLVVRARHQRTVAPLGDGRMLALLFPRDRAVLSVEVDTGRFAVSTVPAHGILATASGRVLAPWSDRHESLPPSELPLSATHALSRIVDDPNGARLVTFAHVRGWPLVVGTRVPLDEILRLWSGSLPLYLFIILGPILVGIAFTTQSTSFLQRRGQASRKAKVSRRKSPAEARLLVRLAHAERRAREAEDAKSRFLCHVSHELRTPLNAIIGFAEAIECDVFHVPGHPKYSEYARDIVAAGRELHAKISTVLEYAALGDALAPEIAANDLASDAAAVARAQIEIRRPTAQARGVRLEPVMADEATARVDAGSLGRILAHLLDNAIAYTPKGGRVVVEVCADAQEVVVTVRDAGSGFTSFERQHAGQPFQRFARPGSPGGMGVGLAIAKGLARRAGATLDLESVPGEGTCAELRIPATG